MNSGFYKMYGTVKFPVEVAIEGMEAATESLLCLVLFIGMN